MEINTGGTLEMLLRDHAFITYLFVAIVLLIPLISHAGSDNCVTGFKKNKIRLYPDSSSSSAKKLEVAAIKELDNGNCLQVHAEANGRLQVKINGQQQWVKRSKAYRRNDKPVLIGTNCISVPTDRNSAVRGAGECTQ